MTTTTANRAGDKLGRILFRILQVVALVLLLTPVILVFGMSFFADVFRSFPPREFTFDLYKELIAADKWREAIIVSFKVGIPAALLSVAIVAPATLALERARVPFRPALEFAFLLPLLMPQTGYAIALYILYLRLGWIGGFFPLVLAEAIVATPFVFLILRAALNRIPYRLEFVAMTLGASRARALWDISLRLLIPAMLAASLFALLNVFDDALYVTFLGGPETVTVSKAIFEAIQFKLEPVIGALSASFTILTTFIVVAGLMLRGRSAVPR